jgi:hypothetical protein
VVSWTVRVRATGRRRATAYVRDHRFEVGPPVEFDTAAATVSSLEHALAALAADLVTTFAALARRRRMDVDALEASDRVESETEIRAAVDRALAHVPPETAFLKLAAMVEAARSLRAEHAAASRW